MAVDYFNNSSNDYINPALPVCPGQSDGDASFEFIPKRSLGVVSGSEILAAIDFSDFSQSVTGWTKERKTIQPGEVVFIQGLTKGISYKTEVFPYPIASNASDAFYDISTGVAEYYMHADISLNYYKSFKFTTIDVSVAGDFVNGIDIANAFNIQFEALNVAITVDIDTSGFTFTSANLGYEYDITNFNLTLDLSTRILTEDASQHIPAAKYPNTAMLGYVLKVTFPSTSTDESYQYINLNHVPSTLTYYEASVGVYFVEKTVSVDAGMSGGSCIADEVMSAGDYLNYVDVNGFWEKVGKLRVWLTAPDPESNSSISNLITGFYLYNPQTFPIMVEYMTIL